MRFARPLLFVALLLSAGAVRAQALDPGAPSPEAQQMLQELQTIKQRLDSVRDEAIASPAIAKEAAAIQDIIEAEMIKKNPALKGKLAHFETLRAEFKKAAEARDDQKAMSTLGELRQLGGELDAARSDAMQAEQIKKRVDAFNTTVRKEIERREPKINQMLARADELVAKLRTMMPPPSGGPMGMPPGGGPMSMPPPQPTPTAAPGPRK